MKNGHKPASIDDAEPESWRSTKPDAKPKSRFGRKLLSVAIPAHLKSGPLWIVVATLAGLVLAIAVAGFAGLAFNRTVHATTQHALRYDIELQDDADDLRVAILDVR